MKIFDFLFILLATVAFGQDSYRTLLHHWDYDERAPLNMKQAGLKKRDGVSIYDISFGSPVDSRSTSVGPNAGVVTAYLVVPPGSGPFPALIYGHWCMPGSDKKNRTEFLDEAIVLAHSGVISLLPDHVIVHPGFVQDNTPFKRPTDRSGGAAEREPSPRCRPAAGSQRR
jgi:hypothetical protein